MALKRNFFVYEAASIFAWPTNSVTFGFNIGARKRQIELVSLRVNVELIQNIGTGIFIADQFTVTALNTLVYESQPSVNSIIIPFIGCYKNDLGMIALPDSSGDVNITVSVNTNSFRGLTPAVLDDIQVNAIAEFKEIEYGS